MSREGTILVTSRSFGSGTRDVVAALQDRGYDVVRGPADHALDRLRPMLREALAWVAGTGPVTAAHLDSAPALRVVARYGVGVDAVDLAAAAERAVLVTNTPGANSDAVADHALALLLAVLRGVAHGDRMVRRGDWSVRRGHELGPLTVGIVGYGRIGRGLARRLSGFGSRLLVHDPYVSEEDVQAAGARAADPPAMAGESDVMSLHAPGGRTLVDADLLALAKPGLVIVNTARADLVDEQAVADALRSGAMAGYAADTLAAETSREPSPLLADDLADRVVVTPHLGAQTVEAVDRMGVAATEDVLAVLSGLPPRHLVVPGEER